MMVSGKHGRSGWKLSTVWVCLLAALLWLPLPAGAAGDMKSGRGPTDSQGLFWFDCGFASKSYDGNCSGSLWYYEPSKKYAEPTQFDTDTYIRTAESKKSFYVPVANVDTTTYQMTEMMTGYMVYFKGGSIYSVETSTLAKTQVSSETGITPDTLCSVNLLISYDNPLASTLYYGLKGEGISYCSNSTNVWKLARLDMSPTDAPIEASGMGVSGMVFGEKYIVQKFSGAASGTKSVKICSVDGTRCSLIAQASSDADVNICSYDADRVLLNIGGKLIIYKYTDNPATAAITLYTATASQTITDARIDRNGYVYFATTNTVSPYTNTIRSKPVGGAKTTTTLTSFKTTSALPFLNIMLSPNYVVYVCPNPAFDAGIARAVPKAGGTAKLLAKAYVNGGRIGDYFFYETSAGNVGKIKLDGTESTVRKNCFLVGATLGGSGDWQYQFNPDTFMGILLGNDHKMRSFNLSPYDLTGDGILLGTVPLNMGNPQVMDLEYSFLGTAAKRNTDFSFGDDVFCVYAWGGPFVRLTNSPGKKFVARGLQ